MKAGAITRLEIALGASAGNVYASAMANIAFIGLGVMGDA